MTAIRLPFFFTSILCVVAALRGQRTAPDAADLDAAFGRALPRPVEARWTLVPWRRSLTAALAEAKATGKAVYLLVNDGEVDSGRC